MTEYVELVLKRNRGWPWPEDSWGLTPGFGQDGWCASCGVPNRPQTGSIVLQRKGLKEADGAWVPHWRFDAICLAKPLAEALTARFEIDLLAVDWRGTPPAEAQQIVIPTVGEHWFDHDELRAKAIERHGSAGAECSECGTWRWLPMSFIDLPPVRIGPSLESVDIAASPEWFGDGRKAFRQILMRRELAEALASASPREFTVQAVS